MKPQKPIRIFDFYQLEDRIFMNGDGIDLADYQLQQGDLIDFGLLEDATADAPSVETMRSSGIEPAPERLISENSPPTESAPEGNVATRREIIFIDQGVSDAEALVAGLTQERPDVDWIVVRLNSDRSGVDQITDALSGLSDLDGMHLVSHGSESGIQLGDQLLNLQSVQADAGQIATWANALSDDADLLIYGCSLASSEDGRALVDAIAALCDCDVAASDDFTGNETLGGDWDLEYEYGRVETQVFVGTHSQQLWEEVLATYTVTNTNDSGAGSLRDAIAQANASVGVADIINFSISGTGVHTITVGSSLTISDAVTIDATTDDSFATNSNRPAIILDGNNSFTGDGFVLTSTADGTTIRGFVIRDFTGDGIEIHANSNGNTIAGNYIGRMTATGTDAGAAETNTGNGINILGANNTIGGTTAADRNVIAGNTTYGIYITGALATGNVVAGNYIGLLADGSTALANDEGVHIYNGASSNTVGGSTTAHRNIISGNTNDGVQIWTNANNNIVQNNYIGTDVSGTLDCGNSDDGIDIDTSSTGNQFLNNLISGNNGSGIDMLDGGANSTTIQGNLIGTQANGTSALGNSAEGILIGGTTTGGTIGGTTAGQGNTIGFNGGDGVYISGGTGISILGNSIFSNTGLGIDLGTDGVAANDSGDGDTGANNLQNFAVLTSAGTDGSGKVAVAGSLNTTANTSARIEFYVTDVAAAGNGEGKIYLGYSTVITDGSGNARFVTSFSTTLAIGQYITSTTTVMNVGGTYGSTSEFSANVQATSALIVDTFSDVLDGTTTSVAALLAGKGADGKISLREAIIASNNTAGTETIYVGAGTYMLTRTGSGEEFASTGDLDVRGNLAIIGAGAGTTVIDGGGDGAGGISTDRIFDVLNSASFSLADVTIRDGDLPGGLGGALNVGASQSATLSGVKVLSSVGSEGAGIYSAGVLFLTDVTIDGNVATLEGGGLKNDGTATLVGVTISNNSSSNHGGGLYADGIANLTNVTISGNTTGSKGGGIYSLGATTLNSVTITNNSAPSSNGGGIDKAGGTLTIGDSIIAGNSASGTKDIGGSVVSLGYNIIGITSGSSGWVGSDLQNISPTLGALSDNGGPTFTHALLLGSRGINEGDNTGAPLFDQRGVFRVSTADIGAFEYANTAPTLDSTKSPVLGAINEDAAAPSGAVGTLVSSLVDFATPSGQVDNVTDPDIGALLGIAVTASNASNGTWYYSTDNGSSWSTLGSVSNSSARLLAADASTRIYFQPNANYNGTIADAITFRAWDRSTGSNGSLADTSTNGGSTPYSIDTDTASLVINAINDAPVNTVPGAQSVSEDAALVFTVGNGRAISIADVDAGTSSVQVTLAVTNGALSLSGVSGLTFSTGDGNSDTTMTFTGTTTNINLALAGLSFTPTANFSGSSTLTITTNDLGNSGTGGALSDVDNIVFTVNAANDVPEVTTTGTTLAYTENATTAVDSGLVISDVDSTITGATVTISSGYINGQDVLAFTNQLGITGSWNATSGILTLSGTTTVANYQTALRSVTYSNTSDTPNTAARAVTFVVNDGTVNSNAGVQTTLISSTFASNSSGFTYVDDAFGTTDPTKSDGTYVAAGGFTDGGLRVYLTAGPNTGAVSGGWSNTFNTATAGEVAVTFRFRLIMGEGFETNEYGEVVLTVDGTRYGSAANSSVFNMAGNNNGGGTESSGWQQATVKMNLSAGAHTFVIGAYGNASTASDEWIELFVDDVTVGQTSSLRAMSVTAVNDQAAFTGLDGTPTLTENGSAVVLDSNVTIFDAELSAANNFSGATLTLVRNGGANSQEVYSATGTLSTLTQGGNLVVGGTTVGTVTTNSSGTLVLTFNANATNALVNSVMQQIAYSNSSDTPPASAQINWTFNDNNSGAQGTGGVLTATGNTVVSITATNDQAVFTGLDGTPTFVEAGSAVVLDSNVTIFDAELSAANNFSGATLTLVRNGGADSQDIYSAAGTLSTLTQGGSLVVGGTTVGTVTTNSSGTLVLTFNSNATNALVNSVMQQIAYSNSSDTPPASAQINWTFNDNNSGAQGTGGSLTATGSVVVTLTATNDAPVLGFASGTVNLPENFGPVVLSSAATITDVDSANFDGGQLVVTVTANAAAEDRLTVRNQGTGAGQVGISGSDVTYQGTVIGTFNGPVTGSTALTITFNSNATATIVQAVARNVTYENTSDDPSTATRTLEGYVTDGDGGTSNVVSGYINIIPINDAPTLSASPLNPSFIEAAGQGTQAAAVNVFGSAAVSNIETSQRIAGLTFTISGLLNGANEVIVVDGRTITLGANASGTTTTNGLAYSSTVSGGTATIVLSGGSLTNAATQTLVNGITYQNTNTDNPTAGNRVVTLTQINDNGGVANAGQDTTTLSIASTVAVSPVNDAVVITSNGGGLSASTSIFENVTTVTTVTSTDVDGATAVYSLVVGGDSAKFTIDSSTGVLTFIVAPDFENQTDIGLDNVYDVTIQVSDGTDVDTQAIAVSILDVSGTLVITTDSDVADGTVTSIEALNANKGADGLISLREAILAANNTAGIDTITFNLPGTGIHTIRPNAAMATITDAIVIDATSQAGYVNSPVIELDGRNAGAGVDGFTLGAGSSGSTIRGFAINRFAGDGIQIDSNNNIITGNLIGLRTEASQSAGSAVGWWQGENNTNDSVGSNTGTLQNGATYATGKLNQALSFDGSNDVVSIAHHASLDATTAVTLDAWIKPVSFASGDAYKSIIAKGDSPAVGLNYGLYVMNDGALYLEYRNTSNQVVALTTTAGLISTGQWANVTGVIDVSSNQMSIYINGVLVGSGATNGLMKTNTSAVMLGYNGASYQHAYEGLIDEAAIFNRALTSTEIAANYAAGNSGLTVDKTSLHSWLRADGGTIVDSVDGHSFTNNSVSLTTGRVGQGMSFNGSSGLIASNPNEYNMNQLTYGFWFNKTGLTGYENIIGRDFSDGTGWTVHLDPTGLLRLRVDTSSLSNQVTSSSVSGLSDGNWHFAAVTLDMVTRQVSISVDGGAAAASSYSGDFNAPSGGSLKIGSGLVGASNYDGKLDEIQVFNRVLSTGETSALYANYSGSANVLGNSTGVNVNSGTGNLIGGLSNGNGNVISGNLGSGVYVNSASTTLSGNIIGLNVSGTAAIANGSFGIYVTSAGSDTTIGGTSTSARNIISGNASDGIVVDGGSANTARNVSIQGNYIGTDFTGTTAIGNARFGVYLYNGAAGNTIGGIVNGAGNVISGNTSFGVYVEGESNLVAGNTIGLNASGTASVSNAGGVYISNVANNTIGGTTSLARNVISGNSGDGIYIAGASATGNLVQGNYIGTNAAGTNAIANNGSGITLQSSATGNTIGGAVAGAGNVISGNQSIGVYVSAPNNTLSGNIIGLNAAGNAKIANAGHGVYVASPGTGTTVGGTTALARNTISGNANDGIVVDGAGLSSAMNVTIQGNYIGTDISGTSALSNSRYGVYLYNVASGNTIGGAVTGAGNVISGNAAAGALIEGNNNTVAGNIIGLNAAGTAALGNSTGVQINNASGNTIGGSSAMTRNVISGNSTSGVVINGSSASNNVIQNNYIGTNSAGNAAIGNGSFGINIGVGVTGTIVGGVNAGNVISGNSHYAIYLSGSSSTISGNTIGMNAAETAKIANAGGILVYDSSNNVIGGTAVGAGNVIAGSANHGIYMEGAATTGNSIEGNFIGTNRIGSTGFGNVQGIWMMASVGANNIIGGTNAAAGNVIAYNNATGITIVSTATGNSILRNSIHGNGSIGIDLKADGITANDGAKTAGQPNLLMDSPVTTQANLVGNNLILAGYVGSAANQSTFANARVEFFISDNGSANGSGKTFLGFLTTDSNGNFSGTFDVTGFGLTSSDTITATATDTAGNTSEFGVNFGVNVAPTAVSNTATAVEAGGTLNGSAGTNPSGNVLTNDTDPDSSDTQTVTGVVAGMAGSASGNVSSSVNGSYGSINIAANGVYTYTVDNSNAVVQALRTSGNTLTDVFTYTMQDSGGLTSTTQITVTIQGANDAPHDLATTGLTVAENSSNTTTVGTITRSDVDSNDTPTYSLVDSAGGRFTINSSTGVVTVANSSLLNYEAATSHNITVRVTDLSGATYDEVFSVTLTDVNEFSVSAPTDANAAANAVNENVATGTVVGITASSSDSDGTTNTVTYSLFDNDGGNFAIDANTGVVTTAAALNRETLGASRNITVRATSADGSTADAVFAITINDLDEFDVGAVTDANAAANTIAENSANGTIVNITGLASDADATTNTITYSLDNNAGGRFTIDANTGVVTVANSSLLDYEAATSHSITIRATSADTSSSTQSFTINLTDVNEGSVGAVSDSNVAANYVLENASNGTAVGITGFATDPDGTDVVTYSLDDNAGGRFTIDANTGVITVNGAINREAAASYNVTIRATSSDTSFATQIYTINIGDVNEFATGAVTDSNATANSVVENSAIGTLVNITGLATDADATTNTITYSLFDNDGGRFAIDSNTGVVTVAGAINRETDGPSRNITIRATSADGSFSNQTFSIAIVDANEFAVTAPTDINAAANAIDENVTIGTVIGITASSNDADATTNAVTYSLFDNDGGNFTIDANTGVVTTAAALNREALGASRNITVRATSADGSTADTVFAITINDLDEFDTSAVIDVNAATNTVAENASVGTAVGITASAFDSDATNNAISYSLDNSAGGLFAIDSNTGIVTVNASLDYETATTHNITVRATSADGSYSTQLFNIAVTDINESSITAVSDNDATTDFVIENASNGALVGITAFADDADGTDVVTYSLDDTAGGRFAIDSNTGVVTVAAGIDRELAGSYDITVRATSTDTTSSTRVFTISVGDVDEFDVGTVTDSNATANAVDENVAIGTTVGITALASDDDATTNTITFSLQDSDGGNFAIDSNTGVVTVNAALDREALGASRNITVRATSADGSSTDQLFTIAINDVDEFDVTAPVDLDAAANAVDENVAIGTVVGITASSSDADATNNAITYSLFDSDGGNFAIDPNTGIVTTAATLDREALGASRNITVRATSADGSINDTIFTININDLDEFDVGAVTDSNAATNAVDENVAIGSTVGITAQASDNDATTNTITYSLQDSDGGNFAIDSNTGVVTVNAALDREALGASRNITIRATSADGSSTDQLFTIAINDVDEFDVTAPVDVDTAANAVDENVAIGTVVGITASSSDADATNNAVAYSLLDSDGGNFAIDPNTGIVTVAGAIDREIDGNSRSITIRSTSADGSYADQTVSITINDVNDNAPIITASQTLVIQENQPTGSSLGYVLATDADLTGSLQSWQIVSDSSGGRLSIDAVTGEVTQNGLFNYELGSSYTIVVRVSDGAQDSVDRSVTIQITDVNESPLAMGESYTVRTDQVLDVPAPGLVLNDNDVDGDTLFPILVSGPSHGVLSISADGHFSYDPIAGFFGSDSFQYQVSDGSLTSNIVTVVITVDPVGGGAPPVDVDPPDDIDPPPGPDPTDDPGSGGGTDDDGSGVNVAPVVGVLEVTRNNNDTRENTRELLDGHVGASPIDESRQTITGMAADSLSIELYSRYLGNRQWNVGLGFLTNSEQLSLQRLILADLQQAVAWSQWDQIRNSQDGVATLGPFSVGAAGATAGIVSVGYAMWALRGGVLLTALYSSIPAWRMLDPATLLTTYRSKRSDAISDSVEKLLN